MLSSTEENYLKALLRIASQDGNDNAGTNELAAEMDVKPASANHMLKKLREKNLVDYEKYGKITLTSSGKSKAIEIVRKHRLWETFLYEKLAFSWDEVHEVAEQLEHIQSVKLINKLDKFLDYPKVDPHGDPIPSKDGEMIQPNNQTLANVDAGILCKMIGVKTDSPDFLKYVDAVGLSINTSIKVLNKHQFDDLIELELNGKNVVVGRKFAKNIYVQ